jgi:uncharacterized membrane protein
VASAASIQFRVSASAPDAPSMNVPPSLPDVIFFVWFPESFSRHPESPIPAERIAALPHMLMNLRLLSLMLLIIKPPFQDTGIWLGVDKCHVTDEIFLLSITFIWFKNVLANSIRLSNIDFEIAFII